ncbi:TATA-box-binding protein [Halococcus saccharolyticus]|uniref:TATA-box-binding protein n=1 Tax=Halococcus saccharolyticus DSM 5350 TaxID=1227455 RepID=M0MCR7_9EURY|nr:TATA-box-binding protein [Halococcus saccharolyticus]EMA43516.1 transcription factor [Halococcus saccharolyticus DSM 5350]
MSLEDTVEDPVTTLETQNVVASSGIGQEIDLESVAMDLTGADFDPGQFPGLIYRPADAAATCLLFRSGKITCTGAGSIEEVHETVHVAVDALAELGIDVGTPEVTVQNIVSGADLGERLNLNAIAIGLGLESVEYEPEQFPGLVYRLDDPDVVALLFGSGKMVITGAKIHDNAEAALEEIIRRLNDLGLVG